jgi:pantoate kinase
MLLALLAAAAMILQDTVAVCLVQAEVKNLGWTAGLLDMVGWLVAFVSLRISITAHGTGEVEAVVLVSVANVLGTKIGQLTGQRFLKEKVRVSPGDPRRG